MAIIVTSNTNPKEAEAASIGDVVSKEVVEEKKSASTEESEDEITEGSEASDNVDETEDEESEESDDKNDKEDVKDDEKKPKKNGVRRRIDKLTRRLSEKEKETEYWREQALKGGQKSQQETQQKESLKAETSNAGKPNANDFDTHEAYVEAVAEWKYEQKEAARTAKERETQAKTSYEKTLEAHNARVDEFKKAKPDYGEKIKDFIEDYGDVKFTPALHESFIQETGPELMYELLKDPDELMRINSLEYGAALRAIGRIEARLEKSSESKPNLKTQTKAPPPLKPISSGKASAKKSIFDPSLSQSEYEKLRREQMRNKA